MLAYVDDILFLGPNMSLLQSKKKLFIEQWECRNLGDCKEFLWMWIQLKNSKIYIDQTVYLQKVLEHFGQTGDAQFPTVWQMRHPCDTFKKLRHGNYEPQQSLVNNIKV